MENPHHLRDTYRFPGLEPAASVHGYPGKHTAIILPLRRRRKKTVCGQCGQTHASFYDQRPRLIRDLSCGDKHVYLSLKVRRVDCWRCGKVKTERLDWISDLPGYTKRFAFLVGRRCLLTALLKQNHFRAFERGHEELPGEAGRARRGAFLDVS